MIDRLIQKKRIIKHSLKLISLLRSSRYFFFPFTFSSVRPFFYLEFIVYGLIRSINIKSHKYKTLTSFKLMKAVVRGSLRCSSTSILQHCDQIVMYSFYNETGNNGTTRIDVIIMTENERPRRNLHFKLRIAIITYAFVNSNSLKTKRKRVRAFNCITS